MTAKPNPKDNEVTDSGDLDARIDARVERTLKNRGYIALTTMGQLIVVHPLQHFAAPGIKNKVEGLLGLGGRGLAGYGIYKGVRFLIGLIK